MSSCRPNGHFWIRMYSSSKWEVAQHIDGVWTLMGSIENYDADDFFEIAIDIISPPAVVPGVPTHMTELMKSIFTVYEQTPDIPFHHLQRKLDNIPSIMPTSPSPMATPGDYTCPVCKIVFKANTAYGYCCTRSGCPTRATSISSSSVASSAR